jgi:hypothetical protein
MRPLRTKPPVELPPAPSAASTTAPDEPKHVGGDWREHDLLIRRFHLAGLVPGEIAVVLASKGLRVKTWAVNETFVRNRLRALELAPNMSREVYAQGQNLYRPRAKTTRRRSDD